MEISPAFIFLPVLFFAVVLFWKQKISGLMAAILLAAAAGGVFYYHFYFVVRAARTVVVLNTPTSVTGIVSAEPGHSAKSDYFPLRLRPPARGVIQVFTAPGSGLRYGDLLELRGTIEPPREERERPAAVFPVISVLDSGRGSFIRQSLADIKRDLLATFPRYLPGEEAAFMGGITLGAKASFTPDFIQALAASGTTHLVALSGYNIVILVAVIFGACVPAFGRRPAFYVTSIAIFLFVLMVGAEPSVVRAAAMGFLLLLSREIGRPYGLPYALIWTAFIMVLFDPAALFMPGFQLSFMSLLGIVYLSPLILYWLGSRPSAAESAGASAGGDVWLGGIRESVALTIAAQLAVVPIALNNFGGVSLISFVANTLVLPFMPLTMFFGFVLILCGMFFAPLGILIGFAAHVLLAYEVGVIRFFAAFNVPIQGTLSAWGIVLYYLALALLIRRHQARSERSERSN